MISHNNHPLGLTWICTPMSKWFIAQKLTHIQQGSPHIYIYTYIYIHTYIHTYMVVTLPSWLWFYVWPILQGGNGTATIRALRCVESNLRIYRDNNFQSLVQYSGKPTITYKYLYVYKQVYNYYTCSIYFFICVYIYSYMYIQDRKYLDMSSYVVRFKTSGVGETKSVIF